jgi:hypothetical protein
VKKSVPTGTDFFLVFRRNVKDWYSILIQELHTFGGSICKPDFGQVNPLGIMEIALVLAAVPFWEIGFDEFAGDVIHFNAFNALACPDKQIPVFDESGQIEAVMSYPAQCCIGIPKDEPLVENACFSGKTIRALFQIVDYIEQFVFNINVLVAKQAVEMVNPD